MDYGMIGKIEKARRYAEEPQRITFNALNVEFRGDNNSYATSLNGHGWNCTCPGFRSHKICPHVMALEKVLRPMLKRAPLPYAPGQNVVSDVEKAKRYADERDRIRIKSFDVTFHGNNNDHHFGHTESRWHCDCDFFRSRTVCSHTMAMERILGPMLPAKVPVTG